jgi:hypothetical protein
MLDLENGPKESDFADGAAGGDLVRHIQQRISVFHAAIQLKIALGLLLPPDLFFAAAHVIVIMIPVKQRRPIVKSGICGYIPLGEKNTSIPV